MSKEKEFVEFFCTNGSEHQIGHNAVDSGHGARPQGPQICLHCRRTLESIIEERELFAYNLGALHEIEKILDFGKKIDDTWNNHFLERLSKLRTSTRQS